VIEFFIFILGTVIGSFLNVVILRYDTGESIVKNRSRCFSCKKVLKWFELIPVISFIVQRGRCRQCQNKISWQYPLVELLTGIIFLLIFQLTRYSLLVTGYYFAIFSLLIVIAVYDLKHQIIPDKFVYIFDILALFQIRNFLAGLILFAFLGLIWLLSKGRAMGFGDAKLALGMGWLLGAASGVLAMVLSFWAGALAGIFLLIFFRKDYGLKSKISFGPFLVLGTIIAFLLGDAIIKLIIY
jgi:leader peptidase (prepilin peptidase) / N-methyltransferase